MYHGLESNLSAFDNLETVESNHAWPRYLMSFLILFAPHQRGDHGLDECHEMKTPLHERVDLTQHTIDDDQTKNILFVHMLNYSQSHIALW
jgi:hypothetical protein